MLADMDCGGAGGVAGAEVAGVVWAALKGCNATTRQRDNNVDRCRVLMAV